MNRTIDKINIIISELTEPNIKLKDTLLKVQVLAFNLKNEKLKDWVDNELNGFVGKSVPHYRKITVEVRGNLVQARNSGLLTKTNSLLPCEYLEDDLREYLTVLYMSSSISELEYLIEKKTDGQINIPHVFHSKITKLYEGNSWVVDSAWQKVSLTSIERIVGSVKSTLSKFLLELADELGENENIDIMSHKTKINNLFDKTIGGITGGTVNISVGNDIVQTVNTGDNATANVAKGNNINQSIDVDVRENLRAFLEEFKPLLNKLSLGNEDKEDVVNEISRIETQLSRPEPRYPIISSALQVVNGILTGVAGNVLTPPIVNKLQTILSMLNGF